MKIMKKLALVPLEEWEKVKSYSKQREMKVISVPQSSQENRKKKNDKKLVDVDQSQLTKTAQEMNPIPPKQKQISREATATAAHAATTAVAATTAQGVKVSQKMKKTPKKQSVTSQPLLRIEHFPPDLRTDAKKILKFLRKSKLVSYNKKLEFVFKRKPIKYSSIVDLIGHALSPENKTRLKGMKRFYSVLAKVHVPLSLVKNKHGQKIMNKIKVQA